MRTWPSSAAAASTPSSERSESVRVSHAVRRAVGGRGHRQGRRAARWRSCRGTAPATATAAPDQLPRQHVGAALAGGPSGARSVRGRRPARRGRAGRPGRARSAGRPYAGAGRSLSSRPAPSTCRSPTPTAAGCRRGWPPTPACRWGGTMVVIEGPRFSTRAESRHYAEQGWTLINMTGHPEAVLARELRHVLLPRSPWSPTWTPASTSGSRRRPGGGVRRVRRATSSGSRAS